MMLSVFFDGLCETVNPGGVTCYGFAVYRMSTIGEAKVFEGGDIVTDFPLKYSANHQASNILKGGSIQGSFGDGDASLNLRSNNGTIRLRKKG